MAVRRSRAKVVDAIRKSGGKVVDPTWPNAGVRAWYFKQLEDELGQAHLDLATELQLAFLETPPRLIAADAKSPITNIDRVLNKWGKKWTLKFDKLSLDLSKKFARKNFHVTETQMQEAFRRAGFTVKFQPTKAGLEAYKAVVAENVNLIKNLPESYITGIKSAVWTSVRAGGDMAALSQKLHKNYEISVKRAALISRDQNAKATAVIENTRRQELGIKKAIWQHSAAGKEPRPTHVEMDGKEFELSKGMYDPDANGPGKGEWIWPGQLINCRCTSRSIIPGFED